MTAGRWFVAGGVIVAIVVVLAATMSRPHAHRPAPVRPVAGPVETAMTFLTGLTVERLLDPERRERWLARHVATPELDAMRRAYAAEARAVELTMSARPRLTRSSFLGYRIEEDGPTRAVVSLWAVSLGGAGASRVAVGWRTFRVRLTREVATWKIAAVEATPGPTPDGTVAELRLATAGFRSVDASP